MIVLVNDQQREQLKAAEARTDRFEREVETGTEQLETPFNPFEAAEVSGVPEPDLWILLGMVMQATGLKKGGIYNHFQSKDELAVAAFDYAVSLMSQEVWSAVKTKRNAIARLQALVWTIMMSQLEKNPVHLERAVSHLQQYIQQHSHRTLSRSLCDPLTNCSVSS